MKIKPRKPAKVKGALGKGTAAPWTIRRYPAFPFVVVTHEQPGALIDVVSAWTHQKSVEVVVKIVVPTGGPTALAAVTIDEFPAPETSLMASAKAPRSRPRPRDCRPKPKRR